MPRFPTIFADNIGIGFLSSLKINSLSVGFLNGRRKRLTVGLLYSSEKEADSELKEGAEV